MNGCVALSGDAMSPNLNTPRLCMKNPYRPWQETIETFTVRSGNMQEPSESLKYRLLGTSGAQSFMWIAQLFE